MFDPVFKVQTDLKFNELLEKLKDYPGDLSAYIMRLKSLYGEMYDMGSILSTRYYSQAIDLQTCRATVKLLEKQNKALTETINFK